MAHTRGSSGITKPRIQATVDTAPSRKTTSKRGPKTTKTGRVSKPATTKKSTAGRKKKATLGDKVSGAVEKIKGEVERKPGKKAAGTKKIRGEKVGGTTKGKTEEVVVV